MNHEAHEGREEKRNEVLIFINIFDFNPQLIWCEIHHGAHRRHKVIIIFFALNLRALRVLRGK